MMEIIKIDRRDFMKTGLAVGGGLILGIFLSFRIRPGKAEARPVGPFMPNAFIRIGTDDSVTLIINKSEMGQGVYTALPMLIAEELECDWKRISLEAAPVNPAYNHTQWGVMQGTGGSSSIVSEWERMRKVGAAAREMLLAAAAAIWQVDKATCQAENGRVVHESGRSATFGELAAKAADMPVPKDVPLKDPGRFKLIGQPLRRLDALEKANGKAVFGLDARTSGILIALISRPVVFGGKVKNVKAEKAKAIAGVRDVFTVPSGVAVVADGFWPAKKGRDLLEIDWEEGAGAKVSTAAMREQYRSLAQTPGAVARKDGDVTAAMRGASRRFYAEYEVPFLAHAMMEPLNCLVDYRGESCDIWTGTQMQTTDRNAAAKILELPPEAVNIHTTYLGGGFGRRANPYADFVSEAAHVAKKLQKPVKVVWTREDDIKGGYYRPMWYDRLAAALDDKGDLVAWQHT
ncbi:MAG: molybdopterin-dependent oxidoreductase, partial [Syntrophales bacterium]|nr:molybdopterin-dependent oxidoreductase [Syntrophales bacterium]